MKRNRSRAVGVCASHRSKHTFAVCMLRQRPVKSRLSIGSRAQEALLTTLIWSVHWQEQKEPFRIPTPFCFPPQSGGIYWVRGS